MILLPAFVYALLLPSAPPHVAGVLARPRAAALRMAASADKPRGFARASKPRGFAPAPKGSSKDAPLSGKVHQAKPKAKKDRFDLQFTCNVCETRNEHSISRHAYAKGTVIVTCPACNSTHLVADNLNWIEDDFKNLEEYMAKQGTPVTRVVRDGVAAAAAAAAAPADVEDEAAPPTGPPFAKIDGITDDQAARIRAAVQANKRRNRGQDDES